MKGGVLLLFLVLIGLFQISYAVDLCSIPSDQIITGSGEIECTSVDGGEYDYTWFFSNPSNGPIMFTISNYYQFFDGINSLIIFDDGAVYVSDYNEDSIFTYTSFSSSVTITLGSEDYAPTSISYTFLGNPCLTSVNIVWDFPNPSIDISCSGTATGAVSSSWTIKNSSPSYFQLDGNEDQVKFYNLDNNMEYEIYPSTLGNDGYTYANDMIVRYNNPLPGVVDFSATITKIDLCGSSNTLEYWGDRGSLSCSMDDTVLNTINIYGFADKSQVPPNSEGQILRIYPKILDFYYYDYPWETDYYLFVVVTDYEDVYAYHFYEDEMFVLPFSGTDFIQVLIRPYALPFDWELTWEILPITSNPCIVSTTLTLPFSDDGVVACASNYYDTIPSMTPHIGQWLIELPEDQVVYIYVDVYELNNGNNMLIFYDGPTNNSDVLERVKTTYPNDYDVESTSNVVLVEYIATDSSFSNNWIIYYFPYSVDTPCEEDGFVAQTLPTGRIECDSLSANLESRWVLYPNQGPISLSFDNINLVDQDTISIRDYNYDEILLIDSSFNKSMSFLDTGSSNIYIVLTVNSNFKRAEPGNFQISYFAEPDFCEVSSNLFVETTSGVLSCNQLGPDVVTTIVINPKNGILDLEITFQISDFGINLVVIFDPIANDQFLFFNSAYFETLSFPGGVALITLVTSNEILSDDYFSVEFSTQGSMCGSSMGMTLTDPSGIFGCPDGTNNGVDSYWTIDPQNGPIAAEFVFLDMEDGLDYVELWDGIDETGVYLGLFSTIPDTNSFLATSGYLYVHLHTDVTATSDGFEMAYTTNIIDPCFQSSSDLLTESTGSFGCPNGMAPDIFSEWTIVPDTYGYENTVIEVRFTELFLNGFTTMCYQDATYYYYCNYFDSNTVPEVIYAQGFFQLRVFTSDDVDDALNTHFYVEYTLVQNQPCFFNQSTTLTANADSLGCPFGIEEFITSTWLIAPNDKNTITLTFSEFNLISGALLTVYNGNTSDPLTELGSFSDSSLPPTLVSTGPFMFVILTTTFDYYLENKFLATYSTNNVDPCVSSGEQTILAASGTIGCRNGVLPSVRSTWLVAPPSNNLIEFTIEFVDLCPGCSLTIYDGSTTSSNILYSGSQSLTRVIYTTHSVALISVTTLPSSSSSGFLIDFVTAIPPSPSPNVVLPSPSTSPIPEGFSRSASPGPITATQSPFSQTPVFRSRTASVSRTSFPRASQQVETRTASPIPSSESPSASASTTPEPVLPSSSGSRSRAPQFTIVPFSPSNFPTSIPTILPARRVRDVHTVEVDFTCKSSTPTCCNNFQTLWVDLSESNYYSLVEIVSCDETASGHIQVTLNQYGSQFFTSEQILDDYWRIAGCSELPLTGDICTVSGGALSTTLWEVIDIQVEGIVSDPSPLPSYYIEEVIYIGSASMTTVSFALIAFVVAIFA